MFRRRTRAWQPSFQQPESLLTVPADSVHQEQGRQRIGYASATLEVTEFDTRHLPPLPHPGAEYDGRDHVQHHMAGPGDVLGLELGTITAFNLASSCAVMLQSLLRPLHGAAQKAKLRTSPTGYILAVSAQPACITTLSLGGPGTSVQFLKNPVAGMDNVTFVSLEVCHRLRTPTYAGSQAI
jgi:hypothetical protein